MRSKIFQLRCLIVACFFLSTVVWGLPSKINGKYYLSQWASPSLANALAELNPLGSPSVLVIDQNFTLAQAVIVNKGVALEFISGNVITSGTNPLTINGPLSAGLYQIFAGTGISFGNTGSVSEVYPQWWGAKVDGITDDTSAINAALASLSKTAPTAGHKASGIGTIRLTKGKWLVNGTVQRETLSGKPQNIIGSRIVGDGEYATSIIRTADSGALFSLFSYQNVEFADMAIIHSPTGDRASWSNVVFLLDGAGGGRELRLNHITTEGFATCIKYDNVEKGNQDTTYVEHCTFNNCTVFCDSLSTQGVVNTYINCTWGGAITYVFYVAGSARTKILSGNAVIAGTFLYFRKAPSKYGRSTLWLLENVKMEWTKAHAVTNPAAKFIDAEKDGTGIQYYILLVGCGLRGGGITPPPGSLWGRFNASSMQVDVQNCTFQGVVETTTKSSYSGKKSYLKFTGSSLTPPDTWIYNDTKIPGSAFPNMSFEDCDSITDITIAKKGIPYINPKRCGIILLPDTAVPCIGNGGSVAQHGMPSYGQNIQIERVLVYITGRTGTSRKTVNVYSDAARTKLVGSVVIPEGGSSSELKEIYEVKLSSPAVFSTEGVFTSVDLAAANNLFGYYVIEYSSR